MYRLIGTKRLLKILSLGIILSWTLSCASGTYGTLGLLGTPGQHVRSGFTFIEKRYLVDAEREFSSALEIEPTFAEAHRGLGLVYLMSGRYRSAVKALGKAIDYSPSDRVTAMVYVAFIRLHTEQKGDRWLNEAMESFAKALLYTKNLPDAYYYMGVAFRGADDFKLAAEAFERVMETDNALNPEAEWALKEVKRSMSRVRN
ncbi:MAG: tetratricopeptide repeat protein [Desulfatiglandaceae bacterium]